MKRSVYYKRYKKGLILGLFIILMSIGYAILTNNLKINGLSKMKNSSWNIHFERLRVSEGSVTPKETDSAAKIADNDNTLVTYTISLDKPGEYYEFLVDAKNDGTVDGIVELISSNLKIGNGEFFELTEETIPKYLSYKVTYSDDSPIDANNILGAGEHTTYKVRVEYRRDINSNDLPSTNEDLTFNFSIDFKQKNINEENKVSYQVVHKYQNLDGTYETVVQNLKGHLNTKTTPNVKGKDGYTNPTTQEITIKENGVVEYVYTRASYSFSITDRTNVDTSSTPDGTYQYGTQLAVSALRKSGYTFKWSDGSTEYNRIINLSEDTELTPVYTEGVESVYTVLHKTRNLNGVGYSVREEVVHSGTPGETITPDVKDYTGFTSPSTETLTNNNDGSTVVEYLYDRNSYTLTVEDSDYVETTTPSGDYYYETPITLTAKPRNGYAFSKWSNGSTEPTITFSLQGNTTIKPEYTNNTYVITLNANGGEVTPTTISVEKGTAISNLPTPVYEGKEFLGWYTSVDSGEKVTTEYTPTKDTEIYARWKDIQYFEVTFDKNSEEATGSMENQSVAENTSTDINGNQYLRSGYRFVGWNTKADGSGTSYLDLSEITLTENITLYAQWVKTYILTFDKNDENAIGEEYTIELINGISSEIPEEAFTVYTLTNKEIINYNTESDNSGDSYYKNDSITINEDTVLYAKWKAIPVSFETDDWETIIDSVNTNNISAYHVGDTKTIDMGALGTHKIRITNTTSTPECENNINYSQTACGFVLEFEDVITTHRMNDSISESDCDIATPNGETIIDCGNNTGGNVGGYKEAEIRDYLNETVYESLPSALQDAIIDTTVVSGHGAEINAVNTTSTDKIYLLSTKEVGFNANTDTANDVTRVLDIYSDSNTAAEKRQKKSGNYQKDWWLRSPYSEDIDSYHEVVYYGNLSTYESQYLEGVSPAFRLSMTSGLLHVSLNANGGEVVPEEIAVAEGNTIDNLPTPTREGYYFLGWYLDSNLQNKIDSNHIFTTDTTLYAKWRDITYYNITFDKNSDEATGKMNNQQAAEEMTTLLNQNQFKRNRYVFVGWNTERDGSGTNYLDKDEITLTEDITLYAQWVSGNILTFDKNDMNATGKEYTVTLIPGIYNIIPNEAFTSYTLEDKLIFNYNTEQDNTGTSYYKNSNILITEDTTIYAHWTDLPSSFETDSWETIINAVYSGNADVYQVGDTKEINMGVFGTHTVRVANNSTPEKCLSEDFSQTACGFVVEFADIITTHKMNLTETNLGAWRDSEMRRYVNAEILNALPEELKDSIAYTKVVSGGRNSEDEIDTYNTIDKLYLASVKEVGFNTDDQANYYTRLLDYYSQNEDDSYREKEYNNSSHDYWLRSPYDYDTFRNIDNNGDYNYQNADYSLGVSPLFRIAQISPEYKNAIFNSNGGKVEPTYKKVTNNEAVGELPIPTRNGYYFDGWYTDSAGGIKIDESTIVNDDVTYYAHWKKSVASINTSTDLTLSMNEEKTIVISNLNEIEEDYTFVSNNTSIVTVDSNGVIKEVGDKDESTTVDIIGNTSNQVKTINVNVVYKRYIINFDSNGGENVNPKIIIEEKSLGTLPSAYKEGYVLEGWYTSLTDGIKIDSNYIPENDVTLYARYVTASDYTITFDVNGGSSIDETTRVVRGDSTLGELPTTSKTNYYLVGWLDEADNIYYTENTIPTKDVTLKAQWSSTQYVAARKGNTYSTITAAINSAYTGDEIILLKDCTENITNNKEITINLNGYTLTGTITNNEQGNLTLLNGTVTSSSKPITNNGVLVIGTDNPIKNDAVNITTTSTTGISGQTTSMLTINKGNIDVTSSSSDEAYGINNVGDIIINDGNVNVSSSRDKSYGINKANNVVINGGNVDQSSSGYYDVYGIYDVKYITMNGGSITSTATKSNSYGIYNSNTVVINEGNITLTSKYNSYGINKANNVVINGGNIDVSSSDYYEVFGIYDAKYITMNGGSITSTANEHYSYGINKANNVVINEGNITSTSERESYGIYNSNSVVINVGNITSTSNDRESYGIYNSNSVVINGGNITSTSNNRESYGINKVNTVVINGGNINTSSLSSNYYEAYGIYESNYITMNGGSITSTSNTSSSYGINKAKDVTMNGGVIYSKGRSTSNSYGIYEYSSLTLREGKDLKNKTNDDGYQEYYLDIKELTITFNANGGSVNPTTTKVLYKNTIEDFPTPNKTGWTFKGWYTKLSGGNKVDNNTEIKSNMILYAHWIKPVEYINTDTNLSVGVDQERSIVINNLEEIEEHTMESNNTSIATVDNNGKITGISPGNTTITIRGTTSNTTKEINVTVGYYQYYNITNTNTNAFVQNSAIEGENVTLTTNPSFIITSFKLNGTLVNGNSFVMPNEDVTITEINIVQQETVESEHSPYANNINNVVYYEKTFEGATSLTVELTYQTEGTGWDWVYLYDNANSSTPFNNKKYGGSTKKTETITINSNYLKIVFRTDSSGNNYYGFKAVITPNYN